MLNDKNLEGEDLHWILALVDFIIFHELSINPTRREIDFAAAVFKEKVSFFSISKCKVGDFLTCQDVSIVWLDRLRSYEAGWDVAGADEEDWLPCNPSIDLKWNNLMQRDIRSFNVLKNKHEQAEELDLDGWESDDLNNKKAQGWLNTIRQEGGLI